MVWIDHLTATLVGGVTILILAGLFALQARSASDGTRLFASQTIHRALTDQIQIDLDNLGIGRPAGSPAIEQASPSRFAFHSIVDTLGTPGLIEYEVVPVQGRLHIQRSVGGDETATWVDVKRFEVTLVDAAGATASGIAVRAIDVHVERHVAMGPEGPQPGSAADPTVGWTTTVRPIALQYPY